MSSHHSVFGWLMVQTLAHPASSRRDNPILTVYHIRHKITTMTFFLQQTRSRVASGSLFAMLGRAIVLIHRMTGVLNFAQGELALLATFVA